MLHRVIDAEIIPFRALQPKSCIRTVTEKKIINTPFATLSLKARGMRWNKAVITAFPASNIEWGEEVSHNLCGMPLS